MLPTGRSADSSAEDDPLDKSVAAHYEDWDEAPEERQADDLEKAVLGWLLQGSSRPDSVWEVGCGTAHFTHWLSEQGWAVVGLGLLAAMLALALALDGITLVPSDARRVRLHRDGVDCEQ